MYRDESIYINDTLTVSFYIFLNKVWIYILYEDRSFNLN